MNFLVGLAKRPRVRRAIQTSPQVRDLITRYIAGADVDAALGVATTQNGYGLGAVLTLIGAQEPSVEQIGAATDTYLKLIDAVRPTAEENEIAVSLNLLGVGCGINTARAPLRRIVRAASAGGVKVMLEMGGHTDATIQLFRELRAETDLGITLRPGLARTLTDCRQLATEGTRIRLVKGEPLVGRRLSRHEATLDFVRCLRVLMESPAYPIVATHDDRLIPIAQELAERTERGVEDYEFQMLLGFRPIEQRRLVDTGYRCKVLLPFGRDWYDYLGAQLASGPHDWLRSVWLRR